MRKSDQNSLPRIDLHIHTIHSGDSSLRPNVVPRIAIQHGLSGIAIVTHHKPSHVARSAFREVANAAPENLLVVGGSEVRVREGFHILTLGFFAEDGIPLLQLSELAKAESGILVLAHPFTLSFRLPKPTSKLPVHAVETHNAKSIPFKRSSALAQEYANRYQLATTGGSDAHSPYSIGNCYTVTDTLCETLDDLIDAIAKKRTRGSGKPTPIPVRFGEIILSLPYRLRRF